MHIGLLAIAIAAFVSSAQAQENGIYYKISGNGLANPSYLYGTIHVICKNDLVIDKALKADFESTEALMLELDLSDKNMAKTLAPLMMLPQDKPGYSDMLTTQQMDSLDQFIKDNTMFNMTLLGKMKPFAIISLMYPKMVDCKIDAYDMRFAKMAQKQELPIKALETPEYQMGLFDQIPMAEQVDWLLDLMRDFNKAKQQINQLMNAYNSKNITQLEEALFESSPEYEKYNDLLLYNRNANWVPIITNQVKARPTFIAVGAAHLLGEKGLVSLLQKEGYTLTPLAY